jgi:hypothetical protein
MLNTSKGAMPADFDDDNDIDGFDFMAWQRGFGMTTGAEPTDGDANRDGAVDGQDKDHWGEGFGTTLPEETTTALATNTDGGDFNGGDFDEDLDSDGTDFLLWQRGYGIATGATPADGDANGDGAVDGRDRAYWEASFDTAAQVESIAPNQPILFTQMELASSSNPNSTGGLDINRLAGSITSREQNTSLPRPADFWSTFEPKPLEFDGQQPHAQTASQAETDIPWLSQGGLSGTARNLADLAIADRSARAYSDDSTVRIGKLQDVEPNDLALAQEEDWRFGLG